MGPRVPAGRTARPGSDLRGSKANATYSRTSLRGAPTSYKGRPYHAASVKKGSPPTSESASRLIDARIRELPDWRGAMLAQVRGLIQQADPEVVEEWKWRGVPVWSHRGIICTGETYRSVVKLTFAKGAALPDPSGLFNASLDGGTRRAIDLREGALLDARAFKALVRAAAELNASSARG